MRILLHNHASLFQFVAAFHHWQVSQIKPFPHLLLLLNGLVNIGGLVLALIAILNDLLSDKPILRTFPRPTAS